MAWLVFHQTPEVTFDNNDFGTVSLEIHGSQSDQWRSDYDATALSVGVPAAVRERDAKSVLRVAVRYDSETYPIDIHRALSGAIQLLDGGVYLPPAPTVNAKPMEDTPGWDAQRFVRAAVQSWWAHYQAAGERNQPPA